MILGNVYYAWRETDWKNFFRKNGAGEIEWKKACWTEQPNYPALAFTVHGRIKGGARGEGIYYACNTDEGWVESGKDAGEFRKIVEDAAVEHFESFAMPDCRCRYGFHWKCGIHGKWRG